MNDKNQKTLNYSKKKKTKGKTNKNKEIFESDNISIIENK